jgi:hypothetical protein
VSRRRGLDAVRVLALSAAVALHGLGLVAVLEAWPDPEMLRRDYVVFHEVGRLALDGQAGELYAPRRFPFLHPPPVAVLAVPLGALEPRRVYLVITASSLVALGLALWALRRLAAKPGEHDVVALGVLASAPWAIALVLGQPLPLALAAWLSGFWAWQRERPLLAGIVFGALLLKPPLALAPLLAAVVRGERRVLAGLALGGVAWIALALPLGVAAWSEWLAALGRVLGALDEGRMLLWKQHTWLAFLRSVLPPAVARIAWIAIALPVGALVLREVRRVDSSMLRRASLLALATVALAPYAYFYDALLLAIPAASLWLERERWTRRWHAALTAAALGTFAWQHVGFFGLQRGPALAGLFVTAWLVLELAASRLAFSAPSGSRTPPAAVLGPR